MSYSADELKDLYDKALETVVNRYQAQTMKVILTLNGNKDGHGSFSLSELEADKFIEEHADAIRELSHEDCMELVKSLAS